MEWEAELALVVTKCEEEDDDRKKNIHEEVTKGARKRGRTKDADHASALVMSP